ncbi:Undecaprenyl-phosphate 4-deoxy-4-formamido-L-arabinose transferase [Candidatus Ornithobacterium hominis]|uniref:Undecaprenyl-phosphate 4-deoxy-4-formamido-L-arabinose transferase n=1 Tax=Candidatus Ornithobacterium hominis TaxID=2497989 RepID=A0A383TVQ2_9FLAO|nr:polyprenol monophosphomannose synthase [Candidatus Ornithobacterium hominis]MCT7904424.1 polyprenol monophosphomannose synthase [Candidatus Ornithobacterium hominis]CAI9430399.1 Undecaprenyl-phosphate 4-deoxy-4-formamido-L-arabinose transferase [Candidatus Ornithobacterium hominis]SZD71320.1 Undecaprenyl-phosphate 4-deoxy-4-formamido-L-arabinose transferase [Candidatus Ornithobacterium hominis]
MLKKLVIIPTYNEVENIEKIIRISLNLPDDFHILVVDDSSPDGTYQKVKELMSEFSERLFLEIRQEKNGLGKAYIHGFKWALENQYDFIFEMDADFSHNPQDLPRLSQALENGADIAIGSRYSQGVNVVNWPMKRVLLSYFASKYVQLITNLPVHDTTAGFVGYKKQVLEKINLDEIEFKGYGFQIEMKYKAWKKNFILQEVPIIFTDRTLGESKISNNIVKEAVLGVIKLRWKFMTGRL